MKYAISILLILVGCAMFGCKKQTTLTITAVKVKPEADVKVITDNLLGEKMTLLFFEDYVQVKVNGRRGSKILKLSPNGDYTGESYKLSVVKKNNEVSEAQLDGPEKRNSPPYLVTVSMFAKK